MAVLVATDIAARGLDIDALPHVVNFELPMVPEDYVHRIGRTGRAGVDGEAISLVCVDEATLLRDIEDLLRHRIPSEVVPGFEPDRSIRPEPIRLRSAGRPPMHVGHRAGSPRREAASARLGRAGPALARQASASRQRRTRRIRVAPEHRLAPAARPWRVRSGSPAGSTRRRAPDPCQPARILVSAPSAARSSVRTGRGSPRRPPRATAPPRASW